MSKLLNPSDDTNNISREPASIDESETGGTSSKIQSSQRFSDNMSILRFIKGNKSKCIELSSSGKF